MLKSVRCSAVVTFNQIWEDYNQTLKVSNLVPMDDNLSLASKNDNIARYFTLHSEFDKRIFFLILFDTSDRVL